VVGCHAWRRDDIQLRANGIENVSLKHGLLQQYNIVRCQPLNRGAMSESSHVRKGEIRLTENKDLGRDEKRRGAETVVDTTGAFSCGIADVGAPKSGRDL
jgi:hypothetical protein